MRTCVATTRDSDEFGRLVGAEAKARNFEAASRRAFVGDGQAYNWAIQKRWFADYVPVVDFIHVLGYVWHAAGATGASEHEQWERYTRWLRGCWQGRVSEVLVELDAEQERVGTAPADAEATDPRVVLGRARGYLRNNAERMKYPEYRKAGLPVTSSWVESLIKEINYRVKGTEKFWNEHGAESVLAVRAPRCATTSASPNTSSQDPVARSSAEPKPLNSQTRSYTPNAINDSRTDDIRDTLYNEVVRARPAEKQWATGRKLAVGGGSASITLNRSQWSASHLALSRHRTRS